MRIKIFYKISTNKILNNSWKFVELFLQLYENKNNFNCIQNNNI